MQHLKLNIHYSIKNYQACKRAEPNDQITIRKTNKQQQITETDLQMIQILVLSETDFKVTVIEVFKNYTSKYQYQKLPLKNTNNKIKNTTDEFNSKYSNEEMISDLKIATQKTSKIKYRERKCWQVHR